jgi:hypothetical protein
VPSTNPYLYFAIFFFLSTPERHGGSEQKKPVICFYADHRLKLSRKKAQESKAEDLREFPMLAHCRIPYNPLPLMANSGLTKYF